MKPALILDERAIRFGCGRGGRGRNLTGAKRKFAQIKYRQAGWPHADSEAQMLTYVDLGFSATIANFGTF